MASLARLMILSIRIGVSAVRILIPRTQVVDFVWDEQDYILGKTGTLRLPKSFKSVLK
jgi:hypothetical protein